MDAKALGNADGEFFRTASCRNEALAKVFIEFQEFYVKL
jgi:hypothetical protein